MREYLLPLTRSFVCGKIWVSENPYSCTSYTVLLCRPKTLKRIFLLANNTKNQIFFWKSYYQPKYKKGQFIYSKAILMLPLYPWAEQTMVCESLRLLWIMLLGIIWLWNMASLLKKNKKKPTTTTTKNINQTNKTKTVTNRQMFQHFLYINQSVSANVTVK